MNHIEALLNLLGCRLPLIQAPMAGVQGSRLAVAVCRAGGLGSLPAAMLSPEQLRAELAYMRNQTEAPFNVNFFAHRPAPAQTADQQRAWWEVLAPYYREFGLSKADVLQAGGRRPFDSQAADIVTEFKPTVVSFHFGLPEKPLLEQVKASGAVVMSSATTVDEACWLEANGADVVIAQGWEAGGHRGWFLNTDVNQQLGTFALLPQICAAVKLPVVAAGGVSNRQTVQAAFDLGAAAVQVGTAFLLADEADTSAAHRAALQSERAQHTAITNLFSGGLARGIVNRFIREAGPIQPASPPFPLAAAAIAPLKAAAEAQSSDEFSSLWAGQNALLAQPGSAAAIIARLCED